ncbi:hypothetical protein CQS04_06735 [Chryseomicrobium excrementi]|uniref:Uncharacterized protein n=1 Tax=Chryseomicrobium excrementi TaxID=2041346 RepID=A0A2M9F069_9BACL|nr:hypothetical protein CQS04_06735 [Chryseomicrobium excrementi]
MFWGWGKERFWGVLSADFENLFPDFILFSADFTTLSADFNVFSSDFIALSSDFNTMAKTTKNSSKLSFAGVSTIIIEL